MTFHKISKNTELTKNKYLNKVVEFLNYRIYFCFYFILIFLRVFKLFRIIVKRGNLLLYFRMFRLGSYKVIQFFNYPVFVVYTETHLDLTE